MAVKATSSGTTAHSTKTSKPADKPADKSADNKDSGSKSNATSDAKKGADAVGDKPKASVAPKDTGSNDMAGMDMGGTSSSHKTMNFGNDDLIAPARGDSRFADGSTGPVVPKGQAPTLKIPDGKGFGGVEGRQQNADDRSKNNYSVTDANFNNKLGVLAKDPDTGEPMNYVKDIQSYNAAGYIETYAPDVYKQLEKNQNAGHGTVLGASLHIMGLVQTADPAEDGVDISKVPMTIPGTNLDAREEVRNPKDGTGQDWARPHHAESHWHSFKSLIEQGVDVKHAQEFSGDDAVSGAGRVNGVNNQDGASGFNAGELEVWRDAAQYQQQTGIQVIPTMMMAHNMDSLDPSALTNPNINKQLGLDPTDRSSSAERANAIYQGLLNGTVHNNNNNNNANNDGGGNDGGGNDDVNPAGTTDGGGAELGDVTGAGTGGVGTVDDQDPLAALADIATQGFADGIGGTSATRLALLLQHLLLAILNGTAQLSPELIQQLMQVLPGLQQALAQSQDPALQKLAQEIQAFTDAVTKANGQVDEAAFASLLSITNDLATATQQIDPDFQALLQQAQTAAGTNPQDPNAVANAIAQQLTTANAAATQAGLGVSLLQAGAAGTAATGQAAAGATTATGGGTTMPGMTMPAATPAPAATAPVVTTPAPAATTTRTS